MCIYAGLLELKVLPSIWAKITSLILAQIEENIFSSSKQVKIHTEWYLTIFTTEDYHSSWYKQSSEAETLTKVQAKVSISRTYSRLELIRMQTLLFLQ